MTRWEIVLVVVFAVVTARIVAPYLVYPTAFGGDARVYAEGARLWLTGGDPWAVQPGTAVTFAAPPHALLFFAPFAFLPPIVTGTVWAIGLLVSSAFALRRLGMPLWWLAFPPLANSIVVGSLDGLAFVLLVLGPTWLAVLAKPYAALPLLAERRIRSLVIAAAVTIGTLLILPWRQFLADLSFITSQLGLHAEDLSSFGEPIGMIAGGIALALLGARRGLWLATPVLWPSTQLHYAAMCVPALTVATAIGFALPIPGAPLVAVVVAAVLRRLRPELDPPVHDLDDRSLGPP
jgi:hypothetical protein